MITTLATTLPRRQRPRLYRLLARLNKAINKLELRLQRPHLISRPISVDLVLTKACNLACVFCKDYETPYGSRRVDLDSIHKIAKQLFPFATQLSICSGGEPYLHKDLLGILRLGRRYGLDILLLSNGMLMKEDTVRTIIRERLVTKHGVSFDGHDSDTVAAIRVGADPDLIVENVRTFLRIRDEEGTRSPILQIRYAMMRSNIEELPAAVDRWGRLGVDQIHCGYLSLANGIDPDESLFYHQDLMVDMLAEARVVAARYPNLRLFVPPTVAESRRRKEPARCKAPWSFAMIDTNGQVMPCYRAYEAMRSDSLYENDGPSFAQVWNSDAYRRLRASANDDGVDPYFNYCRQCEYRFGWGDERCHLGDQSWLEALEDDTALAIDHARPARKPREHVASD